jgi:hypothetical protein
VSTASDLGYWLTLALGSERASAMFVWPVLLLCLSGEIALSAATQCLFGIAGSMTCSSCLQRPMNAGAPQQNIGVQFRGHSV